MHKSVKAVVIALTLSSTPLLAAQTAYAAGSTGTSTPSAASVDAGLSHGINGSVLRPGANPDNPNDYPYLPPGQQPPVAGPRVEYPAAPPVSVATSSSTTTATTNNSANTTTTTSNSTSTGPAWSSTPPSSSNPNTLPDIAIGKPYTIGTQWPDALFEAGQASWPNTGQLTDGKYASLNFTDKGWVQLARQGGRSIVVNLGSIRQVDRVSLDFLQNLSVGIVFPYNVTYYASDNGTTWHQLGTAWSDQGGGSRTPQSQAFTLDTHVRAQYIRAQFEDNVLSFVDELAVFGPASSMGLQGSSNPQPLPGPSLSTIMGDNYLVDPNAPGLPNLRQALSTIASPAGPAAPAGPSVRNSIASFASLGVQPTPESPTGPNSGAGQGYLMSSDPSAGGISNMLTADINGYGSLGEWSKSEFMPMLAQENASGTPTKWLFNGFLFSYFSNPTTSSGMSSWINDLFSPTSNLSQLDQAVATLKQQMNDPSYKEKVVVAIPGLTSNPSNFGSIGGSNANLDLNPADVGAVQATVNKIKVVRWYIQQVLQDWNNAHFSNLTLAGFYWQPEAVNVSDPLDPTLIQSTAATVHQNNLKFYWIPYDGAPGISEWRQLGFDAVTIQPNVSFNWSINPQARLESVAQQAQYYHTGIEMEMHWDVLSTNTGLMTTAQNRYYDYFTGGYLYGYEGPTMKTWYLGTKNMLSAYQSTDPVYHQLYTNTLQFINDLWTQSAFN